MSIPISAPHAHDRSSVPRVMTQVCLALVPATLCGLYLFGWPAVNLWLLCLGTALTTEAGCLLLAQRPLAAALDGSALLTGWLLALTLPPWAPWWIAVGGTAFAIAIGKHLYGGLGQNLFNPAMLARVALLISFPVEMTSWPNVLPLGTELAPGFADSLYITFGGTLPEDGLTGATALGQLGTGLTMGKTAAEALAGGFPATDAFLGMVRGSLGETSALLLLLGGLWLLFKRVISWHIPLAMLATLLCCAGIAHLLDPDHYPGPLFHLLSGGLMLGAFFIATDYVTSPSSRFGQLLFGAGCGLFTFIIRSWGAFPEAVGFAVLIMNALTPLIDQYCRPRIYGRNRAGQPLSARSEDRS